jgi:hypothetical protein
MTRVAKWTIGVLLGLTISAPLSLWLWTWRYSHGGHVKQRHEAADLIARFHEHFNSGDLDGIVSDMSSHSERTREMWREIWQPSLLDLKAHCGNFRAVVNSRIDVYVEPPSVQAHYVSSFEKGQMKEDFVMNDFYGPLKITWYEPAARIARNPGGNKCGEE